MAWKINSNFIREEMKKPHENKREYISNLVMLERYVLHGNRGYVNALHNNALKNRYPEEFETISLELK